jgi:tRNA threonylcarbamoyladenosine biosynthesis protein TsaE
MTIALMRGDSGELTAHLADERATLELGARLAHAIAPGHKIYVSGELGAGKTTLVRGLLRELGYRGRVKSPTFSLVELYRVSRLDLYHFDFYRVRDPNEWAEAGFRDLFGGGGVCLVEWPENAGDRLPAPDVRIALEHANAGRDVRITADTDEGKQCLEKLIV